MARNVTNDIWRAVVFSGAMLGVAACGSPAKKATVPVASPSPSPTAVIPEPTAEPSPSPVVEDPRPRSDEDERNEGRGFVLG